MMTNEKTLKVFIGCDDVEMLAYHVLADSIMRNASVPVSITPVRLSNLEGIYNRKHDPRQSNEFSFSRFLVPYLSDYKGLALFMDCDMLVRCDIKELFDLYESGKDLMCVQHDYRPKNNIKYLGNPQHAYPCKNWSSLMLFNCERCKRLTPEYVNSATPACLHRMYWAQELGSLELYWNWLVGEYRFEPDAKIIHWTVGGPWFQEYRDTDYATEWRQAMSLALNVKDGCKIVLD